MRIITMLTGLLFVASGVYLVANEGVTFLSVAFIVGVMFVIAGVVECLSYSGYRGDNEERSWILNDGITTFVLGGLILLNKISADAVVPMIMGLWVMITGIRNFVRAWEHVDDRSNNFWDHLLIGVLNLIFGIYVILNGHISPGGGFSGGAILGAGLILYLSAFGYQETHRVISEKLVKRLTFVSLTFYCLAKSYSFFTGNEFNGMHSVISSGTPGDFLSGGLILPLNIAVGCVVCCTMYSFYMLFKRGSLE